MMEEQVVEAVEIGMDGTKAGGGTSVLSGLLILKRRRGEKAYERHPVRNVTLRQRNKTCTKWVGRMTDRRRGSESQERCPSILH
jgi:hypothetical protein